MNLGKATLTLAFFFSLYIISSTSKGQTGTWLELCPSSQLCFQHPESLVAANLQNIDSIAGQLSNDNITLSYDLGWYSSQFRELTRATSEPILIDGHQGKLLLQDKKMALFIPQVKGKLRFSMLIEFKDLVELEQGRKIFKSVKFNLNQS